MDLFERLLAIALVGALLAATLWILRRKPGMALRLRRPGRQNAALESLNRLQLSAQHSVHLIRSGDRHLLVGLGSGTFVVLDRFIAEAPQVLEGANDGISPLG